MYDTYQLIKCIILKFTGIGFTHNVESVYIDCYEKINKSAEEQTVKDKYKKLLMMAYAK